MPPHEHGLCLLVETEGPKPQTGETWYVFPLVTQAIAWRVARDWDCHTDRTRATGIRLSDCDIGGRKTNVNWKCKKTTVGLRTFSGNVPHCRLALKSICPGFGRFQWNMAIFRTVTLWYKCKKLGRPKKSCDWYYWVPSDFHPLLKVSIRSVRQKWNGMKQFFIHTFP